MNGAKLRERLSKGEAITMFYPHHVSPGLSARLVELGADSIFVDCEHGAWGFEDVRNAAQVIRGAGGAAIVRPDSHQRSLLIRYLNAGADGLMVPMVDTAEQARAIVDAVRYACPVDHEKRLVVSMIETLEAIGNINQLVAVEGIDVFFIGPGDLSQNMIPASPALRPAPAAGRHRQGRLHHRQDPRRRQDRWHAGDRRRVAILARKGCEILLRPFRSLPAARAQRYQEVAWTMSPRGLR
jgi:2-keto-3-deoxy-L-rhamnonate aldolase RhmA